MDLLASRLGAKKKAQLLSQPAEANAPFHEYYSMLPSRREVHHAAGPVKVWNPVCVIDTAAELPEGKDAGAFDALNYYHPAQPIVLVLSKITPL